MSVAYIPSLPETQDALVKRTLDYIKHNFKSITMARDVAETFNVGPHQLRYAFARDGLESPKYYLGKLRSEYAMHEVTRTDRPISEIMKDLLYENVHRFTNWYIHHAKLSPIKHRIAFKMETEGKSPSTDTPNEVAIRLKEVIDQNFTRIVNIGEVMEDTVFADVSVRRAFKRANGLYPKEYLIKIQCDHIAKQIKQKGWIKRTILKHVRQTRITGFNLMFKKYYGKTTFDYGREHSYGFTAIVCGEQRWVNQHLMDEILEHLAEEVFTDHQPIRDIQKFYGIHYGNWTKMFLHATGMNAKCVYRALELEASLYLILNTKWSMERIFSVATSGKRSSFCTSFKRHFGLTPTEARKHPERVMRLKDTEQFKKYIEVGVKNIELD